MLHLLALIKSFELNRGMPFKSSFYFLYVDIQKRFQSDIFMKMKLDLIFCFLCYFQILKRAQALNKHLKTKHFEEVMNLFFKTIN